MGTTDTLSKGTIVVAQARPLSRALVPPPPWSGARLLLPGEDLSTLAHPNYEVNSLYLSIRRVFLMALGREGGKDIAKVLNRNGLRTRNSRPWGSTAINYMLRNEVYTGTMVWTDKNGEHICTHNAHPALASREDFERVRQLLTIDDHR